MGIADQIEALRREFPACRAVTFTDLATGLVLCASTRGRLPQEKLDGLSGRARGLLGGEDGDACADAAGLGRAADLSRVMLLSADRTELYIRSEAQPEEAIACEGDAEADMAAFAVRAREDLDAIGASD